MKLANPFSKLSEDALSEIVRRLVAAMSPRAVYLFGSQLYGVPGPDSDIDIMVVVDDERASMDHHRKGHAALRGVGSPVELHISSRHRFERFADVFGTFEYEVRRKGELLYAAQN